MLCFTNVLVTHLPSQSGASLHILDHLGRSPWSLAVTRAPIDDVFELGHPPATGTQAPIAVSGGLHSTSATRTQLVVWVTLLFAAYIQSLSELLDLCKSPTPSLAAVQACISDAPEVSYLRLTFASSKGFTPLHEVSRRGYSDIAAYLIEKSADVNAATFANDSSDRNEDSKETPLHLAAANGHSHIVALLARARADISALTAQGASALHFACGADSSRHVEVVKVIVEEIRAMGKVARGTIINCVDTFKCTPLHVAAKQGSLPIVELLLSLEDIDLNRINFCGHSALHVACISGHSTVVRVIAKCRGCLVNQRVQAKLLDSSLHLAARHGSVDVLIQLGISGAQLMKEIKDASGRIKSLEAISNDSFERPSPLHVAQGDSCQFLELAIELFHLCQGKESSSCSVQSILSDPLTRRSYLNFRTTANNTPLHIALLSRNLRGRDFIIYGCVFPYGKRDL
jgi:ankyrin repeat protein